MYILQKGIYLVNFIHKVCLLSPFRARKSKGYKQ